MEVISRQLSQTGRSESFYLLRTLAQWLEEWKVKSKTARISLLVWEAATCSDRSFSAHHLHNTHLNLPCLTSFPAPNHLIPKFLTYENKTDAVITHISFILELHVCYSR